MKNGMKIIYPGTFDPPTLGHLNIAQRAANIFEHLIIAVGQNSQKQTLFNQKERVHLWQMIIKQPNIEILPFNELLVDFAQKHNVSLVLRAIRNSQDFEQETVQGQMNRTMTGLETIYLTVDEKYRMISSRLVKEIAFYGKRLDAFVSQEIEKFILDRFP